MNAVSRTLRPRKTTRRWRTPEERAALMEQRAAQARARLEARRLANAPVLAPPLPDRALVELDAEELAHMREFWARRDAARGC